MGTEAEAFEPRPLPALTESRRILCTCLALQPIELPKQKKQPSKRLMVRRCTYQFHEILQKGPRTTNSAGKFS